MRQFVFFLFVLVPIASAALCASSASFVSSASSASRRWNLRVSPVSGLRPRHDAVRITVVDDDAATANHSQQFLDFFDYSARFRYFCEHKAVHTTLVPICLGERTVVHIGGEADDALSLRIKVPRPTQGMRLLAMGDVCWVGNGRVPCEWGGSDKWRVLERVTEMINTLADIDGDKDSDDAGNGDGNGDDALTAFSIDGDVFYESEGFDRAQQFFKKLNNNALSKLTSFLFGNHDALSGGWPTPNDTAGFNNFGNAWMQMYAQDTMAALRDPAMPFNFSVDPFSKNATIRERLASQDNFVFMHSIGNTAFLGFTGFFPKESAEGYFQRACDFVARTKPAWVFVVSHWSRADCGCEPGMTAQAQRDYIASLDGCAQIASRIKWIEGHEHDSQVVRVDEDGHGVGFRVGGAGQSSWFPDLANFGFTLVDTVDPKRARIWFFPIANVTDMGEARFETLMGCVRRRGGLHRCTHLARPWLDQAV